jgi:hypothetical protein
MSKDDNSKNKYIGLTYSLDENGKYFITTPSEFEPAEIAHSYERADIQKRIEETRHNVLNGKISPLAYYLERNLMTPYRFSGEIGIPTWRIKRHLKPSVFRRLPYPFLERYASFFGMSVDDFINLKH